MSDIRIVHNKLLGGWYVVRGPHQSPLNGRFGSKAEAQAWLNRKSNPGKAMRAARKQFGHEVRDYLRGRGEREAATRYSKTPEGRLREHGEKHVRKDVKYHGLRLNPTPYQAFAAHAMRQGKSLSEVGRAWREVHGGRSPSGQRRESQDATLTSLLRKKVPFHDALKEARMEHSNPGSGLQLDIDKALPWILIGAGAWWVQKQTGFFTTLLGTVTGKLSSGGSATTKVCSGTTWTLAGGYWTATGKPAQTASPC